MNTDKINIDSHKGPALFVIIISLMGLSASITACATKSLYHSEAAKTECARYHPETGVFEWTPVNAKEEL